MGCGKCFLFCNDEKRVRRGEYRKDHGHAEDLGLSLADPVDRENRHVFPVFCKIRPQIHIYAGGEMVQYFSFAQRASDGIADAVLEIKTQTGNPAGIGMENSECGMRNRREL